MNRKLLVLFCVLTLALLALAGCGGSAGYADGTYEGRSEMYEDNEGGDGDGYGVVSLTISGGVITDCTFSTFQLDGSPKDAEYGKEGGVVANQDYYNKAQRAVQACDEYARQLAETGDLKKVDAVSGATINYHQFQDAVKDALNKAKG
jgi:major membrane immunogen (membrane-anchored lipoprotein)